MSTEVEPAVKSTLGATPLLHVLISLLSREATGTLLIESPEGNRSSVFVDGGVPVKMSLPEPVCRLSDLLVSSGSLDSETAQQTFTEARQQFDLHGKHLVERRVLDERVLLDALKSQLIMKLSWASALPPDSEINLFENEDLLSTWPHGPVFDSPLAAIWALARNHVDLKSVAAVLRQLVTRQLRLHPLSQPRWFGFDSREQQVIECLAETAVDMQTLIQNVAVPARTVQVMLYVLTITRHLDLGQRKPPIGFEVSGSGQRRRVDVRSPSVPPRRPDEEKSGGTGNAPAPDEVRDRAYHSLQAQHAMQRAEHFLERHRLDEAQNEAKLALDHCPQQPECQALYAWIHACRYGDSADLPRCLATLTDALEKIPVDEKLRFRRARLLSRIGRVDEALREFRLIVELNPAHIDAQREIRVWEMRRSSKRPGSGDFSRPLGPRASERPPPPGFLSRLLRRS